MVKLVSRITIIDSVLVDPGVHAARQYTQLKDIIGKIKDGAQEMRLRSHAGWMEEVWWKAAERDTVSLTRKMRVL